MYSHAIAVCGQGCGRRSHRRLRDSVTVMLEAIRQPVAVLDEKLLIHGANEGFRKLFGLAADAVTGRIAVDALSSGRWDTESLRARLERVRRDGQRLDAYRVGGGEDGGKRLAVSGRRIAAAADGSAVLVLAVDEVGAEPRLPVRGGR